ncbi:MAG: 3'-5' exonuclease [Oligoflexia bacterium]|nr:3'-5' exonuclease [Oligoflexia bacterium]MBF0367687.1 3'-5' exonuclease [Oligoflexia bacterium]
MKIFEKCELMAGTSESDSDLLSNIAFCVMDLETTGGDHNFDKIIEIGLVKIENLKIVAELSFLINPEIPIPEFVQRLTAIKQENLKSAVKIEEVVEEIISFIGKSSVLVAHNAAFDIPFFNSVLRRLQYEEMKRPTICTNMMTRLLIPEIMNSNLAYVGELFGIGHRHAHRALEDAKVTAKLFLLYLDFFLSRKIKKLNHIYYPKRKFEFDSVNFAREESNTEDIIAALSQNCYPFVLTVKGKKGVILHMLPVMKQSPRDIETIKGALESTSWDTVTIKIIGHFFKALKLLHCHFHSVSKHTHPPLLSFLQERYGWKTLFPSDQERVDDFIRKGFLIVPHLIKEHYSIYALHSIFHGKSELIFRYPIHKKKLLQFITGHVRQVHAGNGRMNKRPSVHIVEQLRPLFFSFLFDVITRKNHYCQDCFFFYASDFHKAPNKFKDQLATYFARTPNGSKYPLEHL